MLAAAIFLCTVAAVADGDTLRCSDGRVVSLHAVAAPDLGPCRRKESCGRADAQRSRAALARITLGKRLRCEPAASSPDGVTAWCSVAGADVSCAMYRGGWAIRVPERDRPRRLCRYRSLTPSWLLPDVPSADERRSIHSPFTIPGEF